MRETMSKLSGVMSASPMVLNVAISEVATPKV